MLSQPTIDKLYTMRGMAEALQQPMQKPDIHQLIFEERLALLSHRKWEWRQNRALERSLQSARRRGRRAWKMSTIARREVWTGRCSVPRPKS